MEIGTNASIWLQNWGWLVALMILAIVITAFLASRDSQENMYGVKGGEKEEDEDEDNKEKEDERQI